MSGIGYKAGAVAGRGKGAKFTKTAAVPIKGKAAHYKNSKNAKELFFKQLQMCSVTYDYSDDAKDAKAKSERLTALQELREFLNDKKNVVTYVLPHLDLVFKMIRKNIFRPLLMDERLVDNFEPSEVEVDLV
jgi:hypothetical protein